MDAKIAKMIVEEKRKKAFMFKKYCNNTEIVSEMWKVKKKLFPKKPQTLPSAKLNHHGRLVTNPDELTELLGEEYGTVRLRRRPIHPKQKMSIKIRKKLIQLKLKTS